MHRHIKGYVIIQIGNHGHGPNQFYSRCHGVGCKGHIEDIGDRVIALGHQIGSKRPGVGTGESDGYFHTIARINGKSFLSPGMDLRGIFFARIMTKGFILVDITSASTWG